MGIKKGPQGPYPRDPLTGETLHGGGQKFKGGRKPIKLDAKTLERLGREGVPIVHVAAYFGVDRGVIYKVEHLDAYKRGLAWLAHQISYIQIQKAMKGNDQWLRILGEQLLDQSDVIKVEQTIKNEALNLTPEQISQELKKFKEQVKH